MLSSIAVKDNWTVNRRSMRSQLAGQIEALQVAVVACTWTSKTNPIFPDDFKQQERYEGKPLGN